MIEYPLGQAKFAVSGKQIMPADRIALLASYSGDGSIKRYVEYYTARLKENDFRVVLLVACDRLPGDKELSGYVSCADFVILRENKGFDFGSWAHAFSLLPDIFHANSCLLTNDSILGPFDSFSPVISKIRSLESSVDLLALTDNNQVMYHLQSYFLHLSKNMLSSASFKLFIRSIQPYQLKMQVISLYEIPLARFAVISGFRVGALFSTSEMSRESNENLTIHAWRKLIEKGFPFVKLQLLRDNPENQDLTGWEDVLRGVGYDPDVLPECLTASSD